MRRPPWLYLGSWAAATVVATAVTWAGVSLVTGDVTSEHAVPLRPADVSGLLERPSTTTTAPPPPTTAPATSAAPPPPAPASTSPAPPAPEDLPVAATFRAGAGTLTAACHRGSVSLVTARPDDGRDVAVLDDGPDHLAVGFGDEVVELGCEGDQPALLRTTSAPRDDDGRGPDRHDGDDRHEDGEGDRDHHGDGDRDDGDRQGGRDRGRDRDDDGHGNRPDDDGGGGRSD